jgi:transcriptional regulator with XRE-family HTH domain
MMLHTEDGDMRYGDRLKQIRTDQNMTQAALATAANVGLQTLKDYEGGRRVPSLDAAQRLARGLGVPCTTFDGVTFDYAERKPAKRPKKRKG